MVAPRHAEPGGTRGSASGTARARAGGAPPGTGGARPAPAALALPLWSASPEPSAESAASPQPAAGAAHPVPGVRVAVEMGGRGADQLWTYALPPGLQGRVVPGSRVQVPFGRGEARAGTVFDVLDRADVPPERLRAVLAVLDPDAAVPTLDAEGLALARYLADQTVCTLAQAVRALLPPEGPGERSVLGYHATGPAAGAEALLRRAPAQWAAWRQVAAHPGLSAAELAERGIRPGALATLTSRGLLATVPRRVGRDPFGGVRLPAAAESPPPPTPEQAAALQRLAPALEGPAFEAFLLWGVTGSGKTEVYLRAIERVLAAGRQALMLVPEIALTPQTVASFRRRFGDRVAVLHSGLGPGARREQWWRIRRGELAVAVGARSAVFAPFPRLGLIVLDEEHEPSYKQEEAPRYHARDVALWRARRLGVPLVLGSATPDLETFREAAEGRLVRLDLRSRVAGRPLPAVRCVDLRAEVGTVLAPPLVQALGRHLEAGRQAILFLNRRGFAPTVLCGGCGFVARCQACSVALCYHEAERALVCHYCAARRPPPSTCPRCGGHFLRLRGSGTERVAQEVQRLFPAARVLRMDVDSTGGRGAHHRIYEEFHAGRADVLVGTQMIAKGWDVAGVTLVGVVDADTALHLPDYRGAERTFQLLCQVAGRAGRGGEPGEVIVQTRTPEHYAVAAAARHDYEAFAAAELDLRRETGFPPYARLLRVLCWSPRAALAQAAARALAAAVSAALPPGVDLWGPAEAPLARLRGQHRWHFALRGPDGDQLRALARQALAQAGGAPGGARVAVDADPLSML